MHAQVAADAPLVNCWPCCRVHTHLIQNVVNPKRRTSRTAGVGNPTAPESRFAYRQKGGRLELSPSGKGTHSELDIRVWGIWQMWTNPSANSKPNINICLKVQSLRFLSCFVYPMKNVCICCFPCSSKHQFLKPHLGVGSAINLVYMGIIHSLFGVPWPIVCCGCWNEPPPWIFKLSHEPKGPLGNLFVELKPEHTIDRPALLDPETTINICLSPLRRSTVLLFSRTG